MSVQVRHLDNPGPVYERMMDVLCEITQLGLVHCDYNEFNVMLGPDGRVTVIDFPQMVSTSHANAAELFDRDVACVMRFFRKKLNYWMADGDRPDFGALVRGGAAAGGGAIDQELRASGFNNEDADVLHGALAALGAGGASSRAESDADSGSSCGDDDAASGLSCSAADEALSSEESTASDDAQATRLAGAAAQQAEPASAAPPVASRGADDLGMHQRESDASAGTVRTDREQTRAAEARAGSPQRGGAPNALVRACTRP